MALRITPDSLARASARRPWWVIGGWLVLLMLSGFLSSRFLDSALTTDFDFTNDPESRRADRLVEERLRGPDRDVEIVLIRSADLTAQDPAFEAFVDDVRADVQALGPNVVRATADYYRPFTPEQKDAMVSRDGRTIQMIVVMAGSLDEAGEHIGELHDVTLHAEKPARFRVFVAGPATATEDFSLIAERDLRKGESFGIMVALVILLLVFGAVVAAVIPILLAIAAIAVAMGMVGLIGQAFKFSFFVTNMVTMMGLAVGIDYSLFIVSRYREERAHGRVKLDAIATAAQTASRAVFFSGMTVVFALMGMLIVPTTIFRSLAGGAILVVLFAVLASLTLLPAVLSVLGDRVNALRIPFFGRRATQDVERRGGFWNWATRSVMGRPVWSLLLAAGVLAAAAASVFSMRMGFSGIATLPDDVQSKQAFGVLATEFASGGLSDPTEVVIDGDVASAEAQAAVERLTAAVGNDPIFGRVAPLEVNEAGDLGVLSVAVAGDPASDAAVRGVERLRDRYVPEAFAGVEAEVLVGGHTAMSVDFFDVTRTYTPIVFVFVLGLSFLLLMVVFRSVVVPAKAILLNLLSVGAAYGLVVLVNQRGVGNELFGFQQVEVIEAWLPLFLFSVLFGLSMDYHVFLLSRIRERYDHTQDNAASVAFGLRSTGAIITGAALIMVAVFGGFAAGDLVALQQMGFGLAVAVLLDATIVRSILVPSGMELLGDRNWYLPRWLRWLPKVRVESAEHAAEEDGVVPVPVPAAARSAS